MGIDLIFRGDGRESSTRFSMAEWDMLARLEALLPGPVSAVVGVDSTELGEEKDLPVIGLLEAIDRFDTFLTNQAHLLPITYTYNREYLLFYGTRFSIDQDEDYITGGMSGIELPGDPNHRFAIQAGVDECHLTKIAIGADGRGQFLERRDLRGEEELVTTTCGRIRIRRRSDHAGIREELARIRAFLASLTGAKVTRIISG